MKTFQQWMNEASHHIEGPWMGGEPELPITDYSKGYHKGKKNMAKKLVADRAKTAFDRTVVAREPLESDPVEGLEGPFRFRSGKVLYYDPKEGKYYDRGTDMYVDNEEMQHHLYGN